MSGQDSEIKKAYARGYTAGRARVKRENEERARQKRRDAFWQRLYLAVLPSAMLAENWALDGKKVMDSEDRIKLAAIWADRAFTKAQDKGKI